MRWEYHVEDFDMHHAANVVERRLSELGKEGWELIATRPVTTSVSSKFDWLAILKRPAH